MSAPSFQTGFIPSLPQAAAEVRAEVDRRLEGLTADPDHGIQHLRDARQALTALLAADRAASMLTMLQTRLADVPADVVALLVPEGQSDLARKIIEGTMA